MSKAGALLMVGLAAAMAIVILGGWAGDGIWPGVTAASCLLLLAGGHGAWRGMTVLHAAGLLAAFFLLGRYVPAYFRQERFFPEFLMVILSAVTFGIALLGFVLDRYPASPRKG